MGIRRRRKKLTTVITSLDRRLRSVEYRHVPTRIAPRSITSAQIVDGTIPSSDPKDSGATGAVSSDTSPSEFSTITSASYSARNITGTVDRVDITTSTDHKLSVGDKLTIYGLNNNDVNLDGTYTITEVPTSTTLRFSRGLTGYYQSIISLITKSTVVSRFCSTNTATLTLNTTSHGFVVGDIVTIDGVPTDIFFNGTFKISAVSGANISYNFTNPQTAISITNSVGYVNSVLHKYVIIGDTWIDTSVTPNAYKIWDGLTWQSGTSLPDGIIVDDHMAPKPPTGLGADITGYYNASTGDPEVAAKLSWSAPTENADGSSLTDLAGYKVYYRYVAQNADGTDSGLTGVDPSGDVDAYASPTNSDATVSGTFSWNNTTANKIPTITFTTDAGTLYVTDTNTIAAKAGKGSQQWRLSGLSDGESFTVSWTSSSLNRYGSGSIYGTIGDNVNYTYTEDSPPEPTYSINASLAVTNQTKPTVSTDTNPDILTTTENAPILDWTDAGETDQTTFTILGLKIASAVDFAVKAYDSSKMNYSDYSDILSVQTGNPAIILVAPSIPTLESRLGTLTVNWDGRDVNGDTPPPQLSYLEVHLGTTSSFTPSLSTLKGRMEALGVNYLTISELTYGTTYYAKLIFVSTTGAKTDPSASSSGVAVSSLVDADIVTNTLTKWPFIGKIVNASALADNSVSANALAVNAINSSNITNVIAPGAIVTNLIAANAIGTNELAANSVVAGKIGANAITANVIAANAITAAAINANAITADKINAGALDSFLITGATIQTAKPLAQGGQNARVVFNTSGITAYNSSGTATFTVAASTGNVTLSGYLAVGGAASDVNSGTTKINGSQITANSITATQINSSYVYAGTINATQINAGTLTGFTVQTAASGQRTELSGTNIKFYSPTSPSAIGTISGIDYGGGVIAVSSPLRTYGAFYADGLATLNAGATISGGNINHSGGTLYTNVLDVGATNFTVDSSYVSSPLIWSTFTSSTSFPPNLVIMPTATYNNRIYRNTSASSREYKRNIIPFNFNVDDYINISPVTFKYKEGYINPEEQDWDILGFIAEDFIDAGLDKYLIMYPNADDEHIVLRYDKMCMFLHKVVQHQHNELKDMKLRIEALENK